MHEVNYTSEPIPIEKLPIDVPGIGANLHSLKQQTFFPKILSSKSERLFYDSLQSLVQNSQLLALEKLNRMLTLYRDEPDALMLTGMIKLMSFDIEGALEALLASRPNNRAGGEYINKWLPQFRFILRLNFTHLAALYPNAFGRELTIAICQWILRDHEAAIDTLTNCRRYISSSTESLLPLIEIYLELGEVDKAYNLTRRDMPSYKDNLDFELFAIEGRIQFTRGVFHDSIRIFKSLISSRKGRNPWLITRVRYGLGMSYLKFGDLDLALKSLKELNPYYLPGERMRQKVKDLINDWNEKLCYPQESPSIGEYTNSYLEVPEIDESFDYNQEKVVVAQIKQYYVTKPAPKIYTKKITDPDYTSEMPNNSGWAGFDLQGSREPLKTFQSTGDKYAVIVEPFFWLALLIFAAMMFFYFLG